MRGHIRKRGNKWCAVVDIGKDPQTGKRKQKWLSGFNTAKEAERALAEFLAKYYAGQYTDPKNMTIETYLKKWLDEYAKVKVAKTTFATYEAAAKNIIQHLGPVKLEQLKPMHIQGYISKMLEEGASVRAVRYNYAVLRAALNTAVKWQLITANPCSAVTPPSKVKTQRPTLTQQQVDKLIEGAKGTPLYIPILLVVTGGFRRGEVLGLKWNNVDLKNQIIYVVQTRVRVPSGEEVIEKEPKSPRSIRPVAMPEKAIQALREERKRQLQNKLALGEKYHDGNYVVCWDDGTPYAPDYVTKAFKKLLKKLDLPDISFHDLRHTHATLLLEKGVHPKIVQERLGHSSITVTLDVYSHVIPTLQFEAARVIDEMLNKI